MSKPEVPPYKEMPGHLIRRAHQVSSAVFHDRMQREGLDVTPFQFAALSAIAQNPGVDQATVATEYLPELRPATLTADSEVPSSSTGFQDGWNWMASTSTTADSRSHSG